MIIFNKTRTIQVCGALMFSILCCGCAVTNLFKAGEAPDSGFLPNAKALNKMPERSPFNRSWVVADTARYDQLKLKYGKVFIAPINLELLKKQIDSGSGSEKSKQIRFEEIKELSNYFDARLKLDLKGYKSRPITVIPGTAIPNTAIPDKQLEAFSLELALVEVKPTNPAVNVLGTAAGVFVPGGGLIKTFGTGSIAFEGAIKDAGSGELFEQFKDRESDKQSPFTIKDFERYAHLRVIIDDWSKQIVETLVNPSNHKVDAALPFSINPL